MPAKKNLTRKQIIAMIEEELRPFVEDTTQRPYQIVQLDANGRECLICGYASNCMGHPLTEDDKEFEVKLRYNGEPQFAFGIVWQKERGNVVFSLEEQQDESAKSEKNNSKDALSVTECIKGFCVPETLSEEDPWFCSVCKLHKRASKKMDLWKLPEIFILHLKRFSYSKTWREKIDSYVDFPLTSLTIEGHDEIYDLYAVSNHTGDMSGGHYTAYVKNLVNGKWYCHDDQRVSPIEESTIKSTMAYVLFYLRRPPQKTNSSESQA